MASKANAPATASHVDNSTSPSPALVHNAAIDDGGGTALELDTLVPSTASQVGNSTPPPSSVIDENGNALAQVQSTLVNQQHRTRGTDDNDDGAKLAREAEGAGGRPATDLVDE